MLACLLIFKQLACSVTATALVTTWTHSTFDPIRSLPLTFLQFYNSCHTDGYAWTKKPTKNWATTGYNKEEMERIARKLDNAKQNKNQTSKNQTSIVTNLCHQAYLHQHLP